MLKFLLLLPMLLSAIDYDPWFDPVFVVRGKLAESYDGGRHVDALITHGSLRVSPWLDIISEIEVDYAKTRRNNTLEALRIFGGYRFYNDAIGDPLTLVTAFQISIPQSQFKRDLEVFDPGAVVYEAHLIVGSEESLPPTWCNRAFADLALGFQNQGSAWLKSKLSYEMNLYDWGRVEFFSNLLRGFGTKRWEPRHFHSYRKIAFHQATFGISYKLDQYYFTYENTVYSRNFPSFIRLELGFYFPVGL